MRQTAGGKSSAMKNTATRPVGRLIGATGIRFLGLLLFVALVRVAIANENPPEPLARDHQRVMYYIDNNGQERAVKSRADWEKRRRDIITGVEAAMGRLPDRSALGPVQFEVVAGSRTETATIFREKLKIDVGEGDGVPAWLLVPKQIKGRAPGVIALHQTNGKLGKDEVAGLAGLSNLQYGLELAERGYVVIAPDYPSLGEYPYDFEKDRYLSGSMKGIWNHMRCVDFLCERADVDPRRIGAIGHSLGGHNAMFLATFDPRVKCIVSSCGWTPFHDYYRGDLKGWSGERYLPRIREVYGLDPNRVPWDYCEMISAFAPRGFFSCSPENDSNFAVAGVRKAIPVAREVYKLFQSSDRLQVRYPEAAHDFPPEVREEAYRFMDATLQHKSGAAARAKD